MTTAVANAVAHGGLNLPGRFQLPPADGGDQADGAAPAAGQTNRPATCRSRKPPSWNVTPKPNQPPPTPRRRLVIHPRNHPTRRSRTNPAGQPNPPTRCSPRAWYDGARPTTRRSSAAWTT